MTRAVVVDPDSALLFDRLAQRLVELARAPRAEERHFLIALSGGSTPEGFFQILATKYASRFPWSQTEFFWGDERAVAPAHPDSNYGMAARTLFSTSQVPPGNIHRILGELTPTEAAAREYAETLESKFGAVTGTGTTFDVALLGVGPDGHTASLFPQRPSLSVSDRWTVVENEPGQPPPIPRISLT
ncbi:MAG: 6-phosphogluconolactonase, partial [Thermoplasmata archaeon]